ncbi:MAG: hydrogenase nickel incorporation protein HypB [Spirochaetaceae bacterium]|nr:hydrogenase nickel incorporation protein HypB [Spirochaetaceae bacterium]
MIIELNQNIMDSNNSRADEVRKVLVEHNLVMINIISSPGSGKTSLLEKTLGKLGKVFSLGIIEGDVNTTRDARRLESFGLPITAVNTRGACHLNSTIILKALDELPLDNLDCIIIENVGNLVCPGNSIWENMPKLPSQAYLKGMTNRRSTRCFSGRRSALF